MPRQSVKPAARLRRLGLTGIDAVTSRVAAALGSVLLGPSRIMRASPQRSSPNRPMEFPSLRGILFMNCPQVGGSGRSLRS